MKFPPDSWEAVGEGLPALMRTVAAKMERGRLNVYLGHKAPCKA